MEQIKYIFISLTGNENEDITSMEIEIEKIDKAEFRNKILHSAFNEGSSRRLYKESLLVEKGDTFKYLILSGHCCLKLEFCTISLVILDSLRF